MNEIDLARVDQLWANFLATRSDLPPVTTYYEAFTFGSNAKSAAHLASLVLSGVKTATSERVREYEEFGRRPPQPGDFSIVLDGDQIPVCVIETLEAEAVSFAQVDASFAYDYGEGDRSLAWWREHLWNYYVNEGITKGWSVDPSIELWCERFRVVYEPETSSER